MAAKSFPEEHGELYKLHVVLDSAAEFPVTKTELDAGIVTRPYTDIAYCIRAALCVSHDLRRWVHVTLCFDQLGPLALHIDPKAIRFMGTDERSILYLVMRGQAILHAPGRRRRTPRGMTVSRVTAREVVEGEADEEKLLILPGPSKTWRSTLEPSKEIVMYCPLGEVPEWSQQMRCKYYQDYHRRDISILAVLRELDALMSE